MDARSGGKSHSDPTGIAEPTTQHFMSGNNPRVNTVAGIDKSQIAVRIPFTAVQLTYRRGVVLPPCRSRQVIGKRLL